MAVSQLRVMGRATQGVRLINLKQNDRIGAIEFIAKGDDEQNIEDDIDVEENQKSSEE